MLASFEHERARHVVIQVHTRQQSTHYRHLITAAEELLCIECYIMCCVLCVVVNGLWVVCNVAVWYVYVVYLLLSMLSVVVCVVCYMLSVIGCLLFAV